MRSTFSAKPNSSPKRKTKPSTSSSSISSKSPKPSTASSNSTHKTTPLSISLHRMALFTCNWISPKCLNIIPFVPFKFNCLIPFIHKSSIPDSPSSPLIQNQTTLTKSKILTFHKSLRSSAMKKSRKITSKTRINLSLSPPTTCSSVTGKSTTF